MKIYTDQANQTAILICNAEELHNISTSFLLAGEHFRIEAKEQEKESNRETYNNVAFAYAKLHDDIAEHLSVDYNDEDFIKIK